MKKLIITGLVIGFFAACTGGSEVNSNQADKSKTAKADAPKTEAPKEKTIEEYDPHRGEGNFKDVELGKLDPAKAAKGKVIYETKCQSCHKLTDEKLVGPGWAGVSKKHKPEWLLNFITNPDVMIDKDPQLQEQLELCMVRMPNQNVEDNSAYELVEFMRKNDGVK